MTRRICYVTGTRADFGLMQSTLQTIHETKGLTLSLIVTGTHLSERYGRTVVDIERANLPITCRVPLPLDEPSGASMARNIGRMLIQFVDAFETMRPDLMLLLGDRGEMLAAALAAIHLNIPIAHLHGGERSGTIDEPVRHAISKLAHFHFVATAASRERLVRMGESDENIYVTGAPGLDQLTELASFGRDALSQATSLDAARPIAIMVYHPVVQESMLGAAGTENILRALIGNGVQVVAVRPNSDAGSDLVSTVLEAYSRHREVRVVTHFSRRVFVSWMAVADVMIGNSSAGIIEAATFGTPVINIGSRQHLRERNANVVDVGSDFASVDDAIRVALSRGRYEGANVYGDGYACGRIVQLLSEISLDRLVLAKSNGY